MPYRDKFYITNTYLEKSFFNDLNVNIGGYYGIYSKKTYSDFDCYAKRT